MNSSKIKTRPPEGPRYACGHRAYVMSSTLVLLCGRSLCADCREAILPARFVMPARRHKAKLV